MKARNLYLTNKNDYLKLLNLSNNQQNNQLNLSNNQKGGKIGENTYTKNQFHNLYHYFDKGSNNIWIEQEKDRSNIVVPDGENNKYKPVKIDEATSTQFDEYLTDTMAKRYHARISALKNLMNVMKVGDDNVINLDFLDRFYQYLFKGTAFKRYFASEQDITDDIRKRFNIYTEYEEITDSKKLPEKKYYIFKDKPNPCHLIKIMKDEFGRSGDKENPIKYGFVNVKELGRGAAGTASLFGYHADKTKNNNLQVAAKLMSSTQFSLTNDGDYLPLEIGYVSKDHIQEGSYYPESGSTIGSFRNSRFLYTDNIIKYIDSFYENYSKYNVFSTGKEKYPEIFLSVSSDNFSNQTIMHMILELILSDKNYGLQHSYIKQYDAMLCYNTKDTFDPTLGKDWLSYLSDNATSAYEFVGKNLGIINPYIDGLNFMEVANDGDLYGHLFNVQKERFAEIREPIDLEPINSDSAELNNNDNDEKSIKSTSTSSSSTSSSSSSTSSSSTNTNNTSSKKFKELNTFLSEVITQLLKPMSVLQHPKYAFVHGDFKTKNVFVDKGGINGSIIYKIADYDKSSINYNGIRFYNSGQSFIKKYINTLGPRRYDNYTFGKPHRSKLTEAEISNKIYKNDPISADESMSTVPNYDSISDIVNSKLLKDIEKVSLIYAYVIACIKGEMKKGEIKMCTPEKLNVELTDLKITHSTLYDKLESMMFSVKRYLSKVYNMEYKGDETLGGYVKFFSDLNKDKDGQVNFNLYYTLTSTLTQFSTFITSLEKVELEQLYVRYQPFPFFHTIDLYTLFLSMLQSPMVHVFLKYCMANKDKDFVKESIFWNSFYDLWTNDNDVYSILGYYDYLFQSANVVDINEIGTIGFILDPIKKNDILLIRTVNDTYWDRVWGENGYKPIKDYIEKDHKGQIGLKSIDLTNSSTFSLTMPNVKLSKCADFEMRLHRSGNSYYVNKNIVVYSIPTFSEKLAPFFTNDKESVAFRTKAKIMYRDNLSRVLVDYVTNDKNKEKILTTDNTQNKIPVRNVNVGFIKSDYKPEIFQATPLDETKTVKYILSNRDSDAYRHIFNTAMNQKNLQNNMNENIIDKIKKTYTGSYLSGWTTIEKFGKNVVETVLNKTKYNDMIDLLKFHIISAASETNDLGLGNRDKLIELLDIIKSDVSINDAIEKYTEDEKYRTTVQENYNDIDKNIELYAQQYVSLYEKSVAQNDKEQKERIDRNNEINEKRIEESNNLANADISKKYDNLIYNLKNKPEVLDAYVDKKSDGISGTALKKLYDICKTNMYKDSFYNIQNWDYCDFSATEIKKILAEEPIV